MPTPAGQSLIDGFDGIRIINLRHRSDRRREMATELKRLGLGFDHPQIALFEASRFEDKAGFPSIGARGCFDSHLSILSEALAAGAESVLILEDDLDFVRAIETLAPPALAQLAETDWAIFYGGYEGDAHAQQGSASIRQVPPQQAVRTTHFVAFRAPAIAAAVPYLQAMLQREPGSPEGGPMHVDGAYSWLRAAHPQLETWVAQPMLGVQRPSRTDIHTLRWHDRVPLVRAAAGAARRLRRR